MQSTWNYKENKVKKTNKSLILLKNKCGKKGLVKNLCSFAHFRCAHSFYPRAVAASAAPAALEPWIFKGPTKHHTQSNWGTSSHDCLVHGDEFYWPTLKTFPLNRGKVFVYMVTGKYKWRFNYDKLHDWQSVNNECYEHYKTLVVCVCEWLAICKRSDHSNVLSDMRTAGHAGHAGHSKGNPNPSAPFSSLAWCIDFVYTQPVYTHTHKHIYTCHAAHLSDNSSHNSEPFTPPSPLPPCRHRIFICHLPCWRPYHAAFVVSSDNYFWLLCNNFSAGTMPNQFPFPTLFSFSFTSPWPLPVLLPDT